MSVRSRFFVMLSVALLFVAILGGYAVLAQSPSTAQSPVEPQIIRFDVSENGSRYVFGDTPVFAEDGLPDYGNTFITQGYIYPEGTLSESNGVLENGDPEFPELVIGTWVCRGWIFGAEGLHTTTGPIVISTQLYDLGDTPGGKSLISEGFELADTDVAVLRALTGGTGEYSQVSGDVSQILLGFNASQGVNLRFEVRVQ